MKKIAALLCAFALVFSLCACSSTSTISVPDGLDKNTLILSGQAVVTKLSKGEYDAVQAMFREDVASALSETAVEDMALAYLSDAGKFKKFSSTEAFGKTDTASGERYGVVMVVAKYEEEKLTFHVGFDTEMQLIGLSIEES